MDRWQTASMHEAIRGRLHGQYGLDARIETGRVMAGTDYSDDPELWRRYQRLRKEVEKLPKHLSSQVDPHGATFLPDVFDTEQASRALHDLESWLVRDEAESGKSYEAAYTSLDRLKRMLSTDYLMDNVVAPAGMEVDRASGREQPWRLELT